jgi:hypothetical protein
MSDHLCLTCKLAEWDKTASGRLHANGIGKCAWKPAHIPTPSVWRWNLINAAKQPIPIGGWLERKRPITSCETYESKP